VPSNIRKNLSLMVNMINLLELDYCQAISTDLSSSPTL
jgi:hypothetical protein